MENELLLTALRRIRERRACNWLIISAISILTFAVCYLLVQVRALEAAVLVAGI